MSRRNFLKQIGLATAAFGVAPLTQGAVAFQATKIDLKIGLLLPLNNGYTQLAENYLAGFKSRLSSQNSNGFTQNFHTEYYKISEFRFRQKVESLLLENKVDIIVAHASLNLISAVHDLFDQNNKLLIVSILGERVPVKYSPSPCVFVNSFNLWQSSWLAGKWAANSIGKKTAIVDSFYDSGFDMGNTFKIGFESGGGTEIKTFLAKLPGETIDPQTVINDIERFAPDSIFVNLSGDTATNFLKMVTGSRLKDKVEIIASPTALNEQTLPHIGHNICGVKSFSSWSPLLESKANVEFISQLANSRVEKPDVFHLLGYESAMMITEVLNKVGTRTSSDRNLSSAFESLQINSPRGVVVVDSKNHFTTSPCYMREVTTARFNFVNKVITEQLADICENDESIKSEYSGLNSGWINPYLTT